MDMRDQYPWLPNPFISSSSSSSPSSSSPLPQSLEDQLSLLSLSSNPTTASLHPSSLDLNPWTWLPNDPGSNPGCYNIPFTPHRRNNNGGTPPMIRSSSTHEDTMIRNRAISASNLINNDRFLLNYLANHGITSPYNYNKYNYNYSSRRTSTSSRGFMVSYNNISWEELRGKVALFAKDKMRCRILMQKLEEGYREIEAIEMIITEVKIDVCDIMMNQIGNQFFQRLLDFCDQRHVTEILRYVMATEHEFVDVCCDHHGTRAVQDLVKRLDQNNLEQKMIVSRILRRVTLFLMKNVQGNHVVQSFLKAFHGANDVIGPVLEEVADHCLEIAMDKSGCCALQHCIQYAQGQARDYLLHEVICYAFELSEHDFGNYVVQYVIDMRNQSDIANLLNRLKGKFVQLSKNKYGSNVVEKCLKPKALGDEQVKHIVKEIIDDDDFLQLLLDQFGNYVVQAALRRSKEMAGSTTHPNSFYQTLASRIQSHYAFLHNHTHGKWVLSTLYELKWIRFRV